MRCKITQYGYSDDPFMDSLTHEGIGFRDNKLNENSCALTDSAARLLGAKPFQKLKITFSDGTSIEKSYDDRAPESDPRLDLYMPHGFDPKIPDVAEVECL